MTLLWRGETSPDMTSDDIIRQDETFQARMRAVARLGHESPPLMRTYVNRAPVSPAVCVASRPSHSSVASPLGDCGDMAIARRHSGPHQPLSGDDER